jgi:hypothetical protein
MIFHITAALAQQQAIKAFVADKSEHRNIGKGQKAKVLESSVDALPTGDGHEAVSSFGGYED